MNNKKLAANRKNARKSTGPKTPAGKAASSRNAVKHGVLAATPVLPGLESPEAWEDHRTDVVKSLAPVGYIENLLAERIALIAWRLRRVVRYEVEVTTASAASAEIDLEAQAEYEKPGRPRRVPRKGRNEPRTWSKCWRHFPACRPMRDSILGPLQPRFGPFRTNSRTTGTRSQFLAFRTMTRNSTGSTIGRLVFFARASKFMQPPGRMTPDVLLNAAIQSFKKKCEESKEQEQHLEEQQQRWKLRLNRKIRGLILLEPDVLEKVARYENGLEKSLFRNLHELQRLQAARSGAAVTPPAAVDVDLTVHHEAMS